ncbi:hypothetical protein CBF45_06030 [Bordetella sp. J329]|nr:hypothetical protein CBF45_06030 [Bordetella sp. J329]
MAIKVHPLVIALTGAFVLAGCGGGGSGGDDGGNDGGGNDGGAKSQFSETRELTFTPPAANESVCYDLDTVPASVVSSCDGSTAWDLKITGGRSYPTFWTNSGISGPGKGGAFGGPFSHTWASLEQYKQGNVDPESGQALPANVYVADAVSSVFSSSRDSGSAAFEYGLGNDHNMYPNFRVFLITTDSASASVTSGVYALQIVNYYNAAGKSGYPTLRWISRDGSQAKPTEKTFDASTDWVYVDLTTGTTTTADGSWHIALNRLQVKLNGGSNNPNGKVAGFDGYTPAGFYAADGEPVASKFLNPPAATVTEGYLTSPDIKTPAKAADWKKDANGSALNPAYEGAYPAPLNFGWYSYYSTDEAAETVGLKAHMLAANPDNGTMIRSGSGTGYARIHLDRIEYADKADRNSAQTWTFGYAVQASQ